MFENYDIWVASFFDRCLVRMCQIVKDYYYRRLGQRNSLAFELQ